MKIVVTGSSGRLGRVVVRHLLDNGHEVVPVDLDAPKDKDAALPETKVLNLSDYDAFRNVIDGAKAICHLGNRPGIPRKEVLVDGFINNIRSNDVVFEAAHDAGILKVVFASSIQAYGSLGSRNDVSKSYTSPVYLPVDEDHPLLPCEPYPMSKAIGESMAEAFVRRNPRLSAFSLRFTYIVDTNRSQWWMNHPKDKPIPLPSSLATYVHIYDAARAVRLCCDIDRPGHTALNICAARSLTPWTQEQIIDDYGSLPPFRTPVAPSQGLITCTRAKEIIGFVAELGPDGEKLTEFQKA